MHDKNDYEDIRPYKDDEINSALLRLISNPVFDKISEHLLPGTDIQLLKKKLSTIHSSLGFQAQFMYPLFKSIIEKSSDGLENSGFDRLTRGKPYLFISNHRDIVLDSAILQMLLLKNGHNTTEITFGSNLMKGEFVVDFGKTNKMFKLERGGTKSELLNISKRTSGYIRHTIIDKETSVWIAQRPGRTKDGHDKTEPGLLKMLTLSNKSDFSSSIRELNIVPVAISYEYEPCCSDKIKELIETVCTGSYTKQPGEDLKSIIKGITQRKGRISIVVCDEVNNFIEEAESETTFNKRLSRLAELIDLQIYRNYKLWPNNYIAYDMLSCRDYFAGHYNDMEKKNFLSYMENEIKEIPDAVRAREIFLKIYANPVFNLLKNQDSDAG